MRGMNGQCERLNESEKVRDSVCEIERERLCVCDFVIETEAADLDVGNDVDDDDDDGEEEIFYFQTIFFPLSKKFSFLASLSLSLSLSLSVDAFDLQRQVEEEEKNLFFAPFDEQESERTKRTKCAKLNLAVLLLLLCRKKDSRSFFCVHPKIRKFLWHRRKKSLKDPLFEFFSLLDF